MRFLRLLTMMALSLSIAACGGDDDKGSGVNNNNQPGKLPNEEIDGTPDDDMGTPNEDDNGGNNGGNNGGGKVNENTDATYVFEDNILGILRGVGHDSLRNDYVEFLDNTTGDALYIDFYSPKDGEYLPTGTYPLGDGSSMTSDKRYTYILPAGWADFIYITEGYAEVVATLDETTGEVVHSIKADYTMENGSTIALRYEGVLELREM